MNVNEKSDMVYRICQYMKDTHGNEYSMRDDLQVVVMTSPYDTKQSLRSYDEFLEGMEDFFDE